MFFTQKWFENKNLTRNQELILRDEEYYMLGDNRGNSYDSEEWGPIKKSDIMGSPILRVLPFSKFGTNPADYKF